MKSEVTEREKRFAQDPDELFDVLDADGNKTGDVKPRAGVHRDGDWHRAMHLWVVLWEGDTPRIVLQRRGARKDTNPGLVDVSVAGHVRAGETVYSALREAREEIGLEVTADEVEELGSRRCDKSGPGWIDREFQNVFVSHTHTEFAELLPCPAEVDALYAPTLDDAFDLELGIVQSVSALAMDTDANVTTVELTARDFVADPAGYRRVCLATLSVLCAGGPWKPFTLG